LVLDDKKEIEFDHALRGNDIIWRNTESIINTAREDARLKALDREE